MPLEAKIVRLYGGKKKEVINIKIITRFDCYNVFFSYSFQSMNSFALQDIADISALIKNESIIYTMKDTNVIVAEGSKVMHLT